MNFFTTLYIKQMNKVLFNKKYSVNVFISLEILTYYLFQLFTYLFKIFTNLIFWINKRRLNPIIYIINEMLIIFEKY